VLRDIGEIVDFDLDDNYWNTYADSVRNLSIDQISTAASDVVQPGRMIWVVVGDRQKIESGIRELEIGDIATLDADGKPLSP
jgi:zinc protease